MPTTTPVQALPIPVLSDVTNVPSHVQTLAQAIETKLVMLFTSAADRTTKMALVSLTDGMLSYRQDAHVYETYNASLPGWTPLAGGFYLGEAEGTSGNTVTLSTTLTNFLVPNAAVTFTLGTQRRVRIKVAARYTAAAAPVDFVSYAAVVAGASATLTGATILGVTGANQVFTSITGSSGGVASHAEHTALLSAGQYTAFPVATRSAGGSATDTAAYGYCAVYDAGPT
jgi:hypothetical protein